MMRVGIKDKGRCLHVVDVYYDTNGHMQTLCQQEFLAVATWLVESTMAAEADLGFEVCNRCKKALQ